MKYDYHDATLKTIHSDWSARTVEFVLLLCQEASPSVRMIMTDAHKLCSPHASPWGESASVNVIRAEDKSKSVKKVEIEMQSGDVIVVEGMEIVEELVSEKGQ